MPVVLLVSEDEVCVLWFYTQQESLPLCGWKQHRSNSHTVRSSVKCLIEAFYG